MTRIRVGEARKSGQSRFSVPILGSTSEGFYSLPHTVNNFLVHNSTSRGPTNCSARSTADSNHFRQVSPRKLPGCKLFLCFGLPKTGYAGSAVWYLRCSHSFMQYPLNMPGKGNIALFGLTGGKNVPVQQTSHTNNLNPEQSRDTGIGLATGVQSRRGFVHYIFIIHNLKVAHDLRRWPIAPPCVRPVPDSLRRARFAAGRPSIAGIRRPNSRRVALQRSMATIDFYSRISDARTLRCSV
jgi:hypothetical protein